MKQNRVPKVEYHKGKPSDKKPSPYRYDRIVDETVVNDSMGYWNPDNFGKIVQFSAPDGRVSMNNVNFPVMAISNKGEYNMQMPGQEYQYKGDFITEYPMAKNGGWLDSLPMAKYGGGLLNKTLTCPKCGWSWKAADGGKDIATCHKCGGTAKMQKGGRTPIYVTDPNDPRLKSYTDSLQAYNTGEGMYQTYLRNMRDKNLPINREAMQSYTIKSPNKPGLPFQGIDPIETHTDIYTRKPASIMQSIFGDDRPNYYIGPETSAALGTPANTHWEITNEGYQRFKKPTQPIVYKESGKSQTAKSKVIKPTVTKDNSRRLMTGKDWQDVNSNDYGAEEAKIRSADPNKYDIYRLPNNKFELVPKTKKPSQTLKRTLTPIKKQEVAPQETAEYLPQRQMSLPAQQQESELRIPTTPKDTTAGKRIAWRQDPNTKKMVPVIGGMKEKVKDMKRLYNKDIPSSTGAIPVDFVPQFEPDQNKDLVSKQMGGWLDELDEEYRRGGMVNPLMKSRSKRNKTSKNIQSSINKIFLRNRDIFGPGGKNIYDPKSKYQDGGQQKGWLDNMD